MNKIIALLILGTLLANQSYAQTKKLSCKMVAVAGGTCEGAFGSEARILSFDNKSTELSASLDLLSSSDYPRIVDTKFYTRFNRSSSTIPDEMNIYSSVNESENHISLTVSIQRPVVVAGEKIREFIPAGVRVESYQKPNGLLEVDADLCGLMGNSGGAPVNLSVSCQYQ